MCVYTEIQAVSQSNCSLQDAEARGQKGFQKWSCDMSTDEMCFTFSRGSMFHIDDFAAQFTFFHTLNFKFEPEWPQNMDT